MFFTSKTTMTGFNAVWMKINCGTFNLGYVILFVAFILGIFFIYNVVTNDINGSIDIIMSNT